jgi:hypothetical protein
MVVSAIGDKISTFSGYVFVVYYRVSVADYFAAIFLKRHFNLFRLEPGHNSVPYLT